MKVKEIFDKNYEYYRNVLKKQTIPLEAREMIFGSMKDYAEYYHREKVNSIIENRIKELDNSYGMHEIKRYNKVKELEFILSKFMEQ